MSDFDSLLFIPFNKTKFFYNESINQADAIIVDFEDSVEYSSNNVCIDEIAKGLDNLSRKVVIARIGIDDYADISKSLIYSNFDGVMVPKYAFTKDIINVIEDLIANNKKVYLLIENAKGLLDLQFVLSQYKVDGVFFGSEDYISNLNAIRTVSNLLYARSTIINLAKAFNVPCYDTIYPFLKDEEGLKEEVKLAFEMGFDGKMAIHPNQIPIINEIFKVTTEKILEYKDLIEQYNEFTLKSNSKVMVIDGSVIEPPHIGRMKSIVEKFEGRKDNE